MVVSNFLESCNTAHPTCDIRGVIDIGFALIGPIQYIFPCVLVLPNIFMIDVLVLADMYQYIAVTTLLLYSSDCV